VPLFKERRTYTRVGPAFPLIFEFSQGDRPRNRPAQCVANKINQFKSLIAFANHTHTFGTKPLIG